MPAKSKRFVVVADSHGDMLDERAAKALFAFLDDWKPDIAVHAGDAWDFRNLRKGASDDEKAASLVDDWQKGSDFLSRYFGRAKENHFLRGNHDERLWHFANSATGLLRDYAQDGIKRVEALMRKTRAKMLPYDAAHGVLRLGELRVVHGYHTGIGATRAHANVYRNVIFGHTHTIETSAIAALDPCEARSIGCLCVRDMDYVNAKTGKLRWGQGWASGILHENGTYTLNQIRCIDGAFVAPVEFRRY